MSVFETVASALKDLIKFKVVSYVNTGDKTQDSLINTLLLSLITAIFTYASYPHFFYLYRYWFFYRRKISNQKISNILDDRTIEYYKEYAKNNSKKFRYCWWTFSQIFSVKFVRYVTKIYPQMSNIDIPYYDLDNYVLKIPSVNNNAGCISNIVTQMASDVYYPIFIDSESVIYMVKRSNTGSFTIAYTNDSTLEAFFKYVNKSEIISEKSNSEKKEERSLYIQNSKGKNLAVIYKDRNFDNFISKYKPDILNIINNFTYNLINPSGNGYTNYNLGFILYGDPGTGKTFFIKALANMLKRDVIKVDMRQIRTKETFEQLFSTYEQYIYCLDEFDCIQGIIQQRGNEQFPTNHYVSQEMKDLKERQLELLKINSTVSSKDDPKTSLEQELKRIESRLIELENCLTLDTVLTVLDGICEMRGRVIVATTNFLDRIDSALLRPGRFDMKINLGRFDCQEIRDMLFQMYKDKYENRDELLNKLKDQKFRSDTFVPVDIIYKVSIKKDLDLVIRELI